MLAQKLLDRRLEALAVSLDPRPLDGTALRPIEHAVMDRAGIGGPGDDPVAGINLTHQVALAQTADRRITAHRPDRIEVKADQRRARAHARRDGGCLHSGVPAANHDDVELVHFRGKP